MDYLKKVIVELKFADNAPALNVWDALVKSITNHTSSVPSAAAPPQRLEINLTDTATRVIVEMNRCALITTHIINKEELKNFISNILIKINSALKWNSLSRIGIRTQWVKPVSLEFYDLVSFFKRNYFQKNNLLDASSDIALVLTLENNTDQINYVAGPMEKNQLIAQYFPTQIFPEIKEESLPRNSILVDIDYSRLLNSSFSGKYFKNLFDTAIDFSSKKVAQTLDLLKLQ